MKNLYKTLIALGGLTILGVLATTTLKAQTSVSPLVVAPARQSMAADPGKTVTFAVRYYNTSTDPIPGTFKVADFIVNDNQGTPSFLEGPTVLSDRFSASKWVTLNTEKGTISPSGMVTVNGTVKIPNTAAPGGKYFAVFFEPDSNTATAKGSSQEESSSVTMRLAALVYLRVNGPVSESASVTKFSAPNFSEYGPVTITTDIKNSGDYHITPEGTITVKDMFGSEVAKTKLEELNVFPDATRVFTSKVGEKWMIGRFTADLNAVYGDSGKALAATLVFWVFPWKLAAVITLAIIIIILIIIIIVNKFTKKEKKLEEKLIEEEKELDALKETLKDTISEAVPQVKNETPETEEKK